MLDVHHEPENDISPGGYPELPEPHVHRRPPAPSSTTSGMWRNVRARFNALGVTNVVWVMNYLG